MSRSRKDETSTEGEKIDVRDCSVETIIERLDKLEQELAELKERQQVKQVVKATIQKIEEFNGEVAPEYDYNNTSNMNFDEQVQSCVNAIKILPPNLRVDKRHTMENVQALQSRFKVTEEHMERAYQQIPQED